MYIFALPALYAATHTHTNIYCMYSRCEADDVIQSAAPYTQPTIYVYIMCRWSVLIIIIIIIIKRKAARWLIARTKGKKYNAARTVVWKGIFGLTHHLPCSMIRRRRRPPRRGGDCAPVCKRGIKTCRKSIAGDFVYVLCVNPPWKFGGPNTANAHTHTHT